MRRIIFSIVSRQALTPSPTLAKTAEFGPCLGESQLLGISVLLALVGAAYAAGYYTRDYISRRRRDRARMWKNYIEPEWPQPANTNQLIHGDLGQMLGRWQDRARARRSR